MFPGASVDKAGFKPTSSTTNTIVSEVIQPKLSVTVIVMLSPFCRISVGAAKFLVAPVWMIYCSLAPFCCDTPLTKNS